MKTSFQIMPLQSLKLGCIITLENFHFRILSQSYIKDLNNYINFLNQSLSMWKPA
jgi:hypothetical protein